MVKLGRIDFANSDPVYHGLESGEVDSELDIRLVDGFPRSLNSMLERGDIDAAPLSSVEYARNPDYGLLPGLSVSSDGEVGSILLFSRRSPEELDGEVVAVPATSATSTVLLEILLRLFHDVEPEFDVRHPDVESMLDDASAALLIGDHALMARRGGEEAPAEDVEVHDLGEMWKDATGERMVYALWAYTGLSPEEAEALAEVLEESKRVGYREKDSIARDIAEDVEVPLEYANRYLDLIDHGFTGEHQSGLRKYYEFAREIDAVEEVPELPEDLI